MWDNSLPNNLADELPPLLRLLRTETFRWVLVQYNHYGLITELQQRLRQQFPQRSLSQLDLRSTTLKQLLQHSEQQAPGFVFLEHFDTLFAQTRPADKNNPEQQATQEAEQLRRSELIAGLNLHRDSLARLPLAFIIPLPDSPQGHYLLAMADRMPDMWSFRSLILHLQATVLPNSAPEIQARIPDAPPVITPAQEQKIQSLEQKLARTPANEPTLQNLLRQRIAKLLIEIGKPTQALEHLEYLYAHTDKPDEKAQYAIDQGDCHKALGRSKQAFIHYQNAESLAELGSYRLGMVWERMGDIYTQWGQLNDALNYFEKYTRLNEQLHKSNPESPEYINGLAISYEKMGDTLAILGRLTEALSYFEKDALLTEQLHATAPEHQIYNADLAIAYGRMGEVLAQLNRPQDSLLFFEQGTKLFEALHNAAPERNDYKNGLATLYQFMGKTYSQIGHPSNAYEYFIKCSLLFEQLHNSSPEQPIYTYGLAASYEKLGDTLVQKNNTPEALHYFEEQTKLFKQLHTSYPEQPNYASGLAFGHSKMGNVLVQLNRLSEAFNCFEHAKALREELIAITPEQPDHISGLATSYKQLGDWYKRNKDNNIAKNYFEKAKDILVSLVENYPDYVKFKTYLEEVLGDLQQLENE